MKNARKSELDAIASAPIEIFSKLIKSFHELDTIQGLMFNLICKTFGKYLFHVMFRKWCNMMPLGMHFFICDIKFQRDLALPIHVKTMENAKRQTMADLLVNVQMALKEIAVN